MPITYQNADGSIVEPSPTPLSISVLAPAFKFNPATITIRTLVPGGGKGGIVDPATAADRTTYVVWGDPITGSTSQVLELERRIKHLELERTEIAFPTSTDRKKEANRKRSEIAQIVAAGTPSTYSKKPKSIPTAWNCHRNNQHDLHTSLSNEILGQFYTDLYEMSPSKVDCKLALKLTDIANKIYQGKEDEMNTDYNDWAFEAGFHMERESIGGGTTDVTYTFKKNRKSSLILNREDKKAGGNADLKNASYYSKFWCDSQNWNSQPEITCPSILMTITGSDCTLSAAVFTAKGVNIDCYFSTSLLWIEDDEKHKIRIVRMVAALRKVLGALTTFYESGNEQEPAIDGFPYLRSFNGETFSYVRRCGENRLYSANTHSGKRIAVKCTRNYSIDAHEILANINCAPKLLFHSQLSGGWTAIIMDWVEGAPWSHFDFQDGEKERAFKTLEEAVGILHQKGYVHGDLRVNNILVDNSGGPKIIDFDWADLEGEAKYPFYMNHEEIRWPEGASDGTSITKNHDLFMLKSLILGQSRSRSNSSNQQIGKTEETWEVLNLTLKKIIGDGNCMYRCFGVEFQEDHITVRYKMVKEMMKAEKATYDKYNIDMVECTKASCTVGEDGEHINLAFLSKVYDCNIHIHRRGQTSHAINHDEIPTVSLQQAPFNKQPSKQSSSGVLLLPSLLE